MKISGFSLKKASSVTQKSSFFDDAPADDVFDDKSGDNSGEKSPVVKKRSIVSVFSEANGDSTKKNDNSDHGDDDDEPALVIEMKRSLPPGVDKDTTFDSNGAYLAERAKMTANTGGDEKAKYQNDLEWRAEDVDLDVYDKVPVEKFGEAMLRGMSNEWKPGKALGKDGRGLVAPIAFVPRPNLIGLGAEPKIKDELLGKAGKTRKRRPGEDRLPANKTVVSIAKNSSGGHRHMVSVDEMENAKKVPLGMDLGNRVRVSIRENESCVGIVRIIEKDLMHIHIDITSGKNVGKRIRVPVSKAQDIGGEGGGGGGETFSNLSSRFVVDGNFKRDSNRDDDTRMQIEEGTKNNSNDGDDPNATDSGDNSINRDRGVGQDDREHYDRSSDTREYSSHSGSGSRSRSNHSRSHHGDSHYSTSSHDRDRDRHDRDRHSHHSHRSRYHHYRDRDRRR